MFLTLFQRYKFLDVGLSTVIFFVLVGTILLKLKRYEDETGELNTFSDSFNPDGSSCGLEEKSDPGGGGRVGDLSIIAYTGRLRPKGVSFSGFRHMKG